MLRALTIGVRALTIGVGTVSQEIERKFLLANDGWKSSVVSKVRIRDGLVAILNGRKARVRLIGERATIALKGQHRGLGRSEFEYPIPTPDAEEILKTMCDDRTLEKVRHYVPHRGLTWEIDVYEGLLEGVVIAEVELDRADRVLELPDWVGREISGDQRYSKFNMEKAARRLARRRASHPPQPPDAAFSLAENEGLGSNRQACNHFSGETHA